MTHVQLALSIATVVGMAGCTADCPTGPDGSVAADDLNAMPFDLAMNDLAAVTDLTVDQSVSPMDLTVDAARGPISSAPCRTGGNVVYIAGDFGSPSPGYWHLHPNGWTPQDGPRPNFFHYWAVGATADSFRIGLAPPTNQSLVPGQYDNARGGLLSAAHPWMIVGLGSSACNGDVEGWFNIESITGTINGFHTEMTATFEQHCAGESPAIRGCVHFEQQFDNGDGGP